MDDKRKLLLKKAALNNGILKVEMARQLYSSDSSAESALSSLEFQGFIQLRNPGVFEVKKLPSDVMEQLERELDGD